MLGMKQTLLVMTLILWCIMEIQIVVHKVLTSLVVSKKYHLTRQMFRISM